MALRATRLLTALVGGGLVTGSVLLGAGTALAAPGDVVPAQCGQTVTARPGDTVSVTPALGLPFTVPVVAGMDPISQLVGGLLCRVQVNVVAPAAASVARVAPPLASAAGTVRDGAGAALRPSTQARTAPRSQVVAPAPAAVAPAAPAALPPAQAAAAAPAFAPAFGALPASFLRSASAGPAPGLRYDAGLLLGSAFPGLRNGAPAYLGYDAASAVTTASQVQALPVDALDKGGVGVPALLAVLALSGVAAFSVRRVVLGRGPAPSSAPTVAAPETPAAAPAATSPSPAPADGTADALDGTADLGDPGDLTPTAVTDRALAPA